MRFQEFRDGKDITPLRKALYYGGMALTVIGLLLFLSVFFSIAASMGSFDAFDKGAGFTLRGIIGFIMVIAGQIMSRIGARGLAGSGMVLDPQRARQDLAPYTDAMGGMARDAVDAFKADGGPVKQALR